ncbi:heparinase II/III family protein [Streptomyces sp. NPDC026672]|uniref:heparinase II/III domain-containing protein n=1 Tax=unclassified Streptomyces TaxID=2593676 RepID=UPI0033C87774
MFTLTRLRTALERADGSPALAPEDFRALPARPHLAPLLDRVRAEADRAVVEGPQPLPTWSLHRRYADNGDRLSYERPYFARRGRLCALAVAALVDGEPVVVTALADMLWSVCDEYTWALPAHAWCAGAMGTGMDRCVDLFASETAHTLAELTALLRGVLPGPVLDRVVHEVRRRVLTPVFAEPRPHPWETMANNWSAVCAGSAGMALLAVEDDPAVLATGLRRVLGAMDTFRGGLTPDGGCPEGAAYWEYGVGYYVYFAEALRARTGLDLLAATPGMAEIAAFPAAVQLGGGTPVPFSDSAVARMGAVGLLSRLHHRFGAPWPDVSDVPDLDEDHCHRWAHLSRTLLWTDPALLGRTVPAGTSWLPDPAWLIDRGELDGVPVAFAAKGGHNDEPHNHDDLGHFVLGVAGEPLLTDLGAGEYTEEYFTDRRPTLLHPGAEGHSVPVVGGHPQRTGAGAVARTLDVRLRPDGADLRLDLTAGYPHGPSLVRSFRWHRDTATLELTDSFGPSPAGPVPVEELFVSRLRPRLLPGAVRWTSASGTATLTYDEHVWRPVVEEIRTTDHSGAPDTVHRLRLHGRSAPEHRFVLTLSATGTASPTAG